MTGRNRGIRWTVSSDYEFPDDRIFLKKSKEKRKGLYKDDIMSLCHTLHQAILGLESSETCMQGICLYFYTLRSPFTFKRHFTLLKDTLRLVYFAAIFCLSISKGQLCLLGYNLVKQVPL